MGPVAYLLYISAVILAVAYATAYVHDEFSAAWSLAYLIAINIVTFAFYAYDKVLATLLDSLYLGFLPLRVPEDVLVWWLAFPGGIFGAAAAVYMLNHKTGPKKRDFRIELLKAYAIQATLLLVSLLIVRGRVSVSQEELDVFVEKLANTVLDFVQMLLATIRTS